jgi:hypothetical protein
MSFLARLQIGRPEKVVLHDNFGRAEKPILQRCIGIYSSSSYFQEVSFPCVIEDEALR